MTGRHHLKRGRLPMILLFIGLTAGLSTADSEKKSTGWEKGSPYNRLYHAAESDRIKGTVRDIVEKVPMTAMAPATVIVLQTDDADKTLVHVCPASHIAPKDLGLKKGDEVKIRGAWAEIDGEDIFMAAKIKKGDFFELKVRLTQDGTPFWTLSPEELAREKNNE